jgi:hypothetical protein
MFDLTHFPVLTVILILGYPAIAILCWNSPVASLPGSRLFPPSCVA